MKNEYPWIYKDINNNVWKYYLNQNNELVYKVMYNEGKWTREKIVCKEINTFTVYVDVYNKVHIVYSNLKGEIVYCTINDNKWMGKVLYKADNSNIVISDLKIEIMEENMHIFFLLCENNGRDHGILMHCIWDGKNTKFNRIYDIILPSVSDEYYYIKIGITGNINLFFLTDAGDEIALNYLIYENDFWTDPVRLYGLKGEKISVRIIIANTGIHILNGIEENSIYTLEHVCIDFDNKISNYKVFESKSEIIEPIIFYKNNNVYICFIEENKIKCLLYDNENWSEAMEVNIDSAVNLKIYNCIFVFNTSVLISTVYGTEDVDARLYDFDYILKMTFDSEAHFEKNGESNVSHDDVKKIKEKISEVNSVNKIFENKISILQAELQKKQKFIENYEKRINKVFTQKSISDENCSMLADIKNKLEQSLDTIKEKLEEEKDARKALDDQNNILFEENSMLKSQIEDLKEENKKVKQELEIEKNESIFSHILRKK
ncbi:hypothetical protein D4Z93_05025 [Clostridium fermenticellae]|uniref:Uncharacterized protein n=1 Tax=Clostridium fermenticellae TaxID=2068654 RepID=A0A386H2I0_9CLOT|nr:hypothetical protein [Clostridium fermenticellae]AYD39912.1 hypothetical protein D4Z93_05025 [Clostridium fermenticellae]